MVTAVMGTEGTVTENTGTADMAMGNMAMEDKVMEALEMKREFREDIYRLALEISI